MKANGAMTANEGRNMYGKTAMTLGVVFIDGATRHDRPRQCSLARTPWAFLQIVGHVFAPWRRRWRLRWGARPGEPDLSLPGEDLIPHATREYTHGVSIAAPPEDVWPWIAQMGQGRGGLYSFEPLENTVGCRITNADTILPERQMPT